MVDHNGDWWAMLPGTDHTDEQLRKAAAEVTGTSGKFETKVEHYGYAPRVKWCGDRFGDACDSEGGWHRHWWGAQPGHGTAWTQARFNPNA